MSVREDRLRAEYNAMRKFRSNVVSWETVGNHNPPDIYHFTYNLKSVVGFSGGKPRFHRGFKVEISFPPNYPRSQPKVWLTSKPYPYHPNIFTSGHFCLEGVTELGKTQHWIPGIGVPLDWICLMIGEMIAFQEVGLESPANGDPTLRSWVKNELCFISISKVSNPVDPSPIRLPDLEDAISWGGEPARPQPRIRFG